MEKQDESDVLTCDDLSQDMLSVSPDHALLATTSTSFVVGSSEPLDVDGFIHQFMHKNLERELEMGHLRKMAEMVRQQNIAFVSKIKQLQQIQGKLEQELSTTKGHQCSPDGAARCTTDGANAVWCHQLLAATTILRKYTLQTVSC
ncbi:hypothetical protein LSAT2_011973 [Lamellibrachia satsuma]|nr:hypothetical protein LSAT2_011973 [Lamellibrachia satsuma]